MTVTTKGIPEVVAYIRSLSTLQEEVIDGIAAVGYEGMRQGAGRHSPRPGGTGKLYASLYNRLIPKGRQVGHDTGQAPYAEWVIAGAVAHIIKPRNAKALRWFAWPGGPAVFSKGVKHPGYAGDNYLARAADDAVKSLAAIVDRTLKG